MAILEFERRKRSESHLDMTPLIDMVFLLLIFFILSSHFVSHQGFKVKLPKAVSSQTQQNEKVTVFIDSNGGIFLNDSEIKLEQLQRIIRLELNKANSKTVVIKADEEVALGLAVKVMDVAKEANADGLVISTKTPRDEKKQ